MQNWQKDRNYRKHKNANGFFIYVITVDDKDVEVQEEVYKAYSRPTAGRGIKPSATPGGCSRWNE